MIGGWSAHGRYIRLSRLLPCHEVGVDLTLRLHRQSEEDLLFPLWYQTLRRTSSLCSLLRRVERCQMRDHVRGYGWR